MKISRTATAGAVVLCMTLLGAGSQMRGTEQAAGADRAAGASGSQIGQAGQGSQSTSGTAVVEAKDLKAETVTLNGQKYAVVPATRILDLKGKVIQLKDLPVSRMGPDEGIVAMPIMARFTAVQTGRGWSLESLQVMGRPPE